MRTENVYKGLKKYKCDNCGKQYSQKIDLTVHSRFDHEKIK